MSHSRTPVLEYSKAECHSVVPPDIILLPNPSCFSLSQNSPDRDKSSRTLFWNGVRAGRHLSRMLCRPMLLLNSTLVVYSYANVTPSLLYGHAVIKVMSRCDYCVDVLAKLPLEAFVSLGDILFQDTGNLHLDCSYFYFSHRIPPLGICCVMQWMFPPPVNISLA